LTRRLANEFSAKFVELTNLIFVDGALPAKTKELMAVAAAQVTLCEHCIERHTKRAVEFGATRQEITEAIWVGIAMRAGAAVHRSRAAFSTIERMRG
jgi:AhpD family alkylhydroperoxidase